MSANVEARERRLNVHLYRLSASSLDVWQTNFQIEDLKNLEEKGVISNAEERVRK